MRVKEGKENETKEKNEISSPSLLLEFSRPRPIDSFSSSLSSLPLSCARDLTPLVTFSFRFAPAFKRDHFRSERAKQARADDE